MGIRESSSIYETAAGTLFVPAEDMWLVHEAAKPSSIAGRAGVRPDALTKWGKRHGEALISWLHWKGPRPIGIRYHITQQRFRDEASVLAICRAAHRTERSVRPGRPIGDHVSTTMVHSWLRRHQGIDWFRRWLFDDVPPPGNVTIATSTMIRRCRKAWDYVEHCRAAGISSVNCYIVSWLLRGQINFEWLKWLYGWPVPNGYCVKTRAAKRGQTGIIASHLFSASPQMLAFREVAHAEWVAQKISALSDMVGFWEWFLDWTMPTARHGRQILDHFRNGASVNNGHAANDQQSPPGQTVLNTSPPKRGRRTKDDSDDFLKANYDAYLGPEKLDTARERLRQRWRRRAPKENSHLRKYAQRYAEAHELPDPVPIRAARSEQATHKTL